MRAKEFIIENADPKKDPEAYRTYLENHRDFMLGFLNRTIKPNSWKPSRKEMQDAIDIAVEVMEKTRDVKVAGKALNDHLEMLHKESQAGIKTQNDGQLDEAIGQDAIKVLKAVGWAGKQGLRGLWWGITNPGKAIAAAAAITHPREFYYAGNFAWNLLTDPVNTAKVIAKYGWDVTKPWGSAKEAEAALMALMGKTSTSDFIFNLAEFAVRNAIPIAGVIALLYGGKKFVDYLRQKETEQPGSKAFNRIQQDLSNKSNQGVAEETIDEMALAKYQTFGDFDKPGPFRGPDKKLVPHPKNIEKATTFFEKTPYDFRLFFSNVPGTGKYSEYGAMPPEMITKIFGKEQAAEIINGSEDAITVVYVGNKGDRKVMLTPWMMAHRFGHAIQAEAGYGKKNWMAWAEAEKYFFQTVNSVLEEHYGKAYRGANTYNTPIKWDLTPEYNALFNAIGTQRSSRSGQIRRPYEFLYEIFAQYLGTGKVTFNLFPANLGYGRQAWGTPTKYLNIKPEYRDELSRKQEADRLAYTMELLFNDVLSSSVGKIFVM